MFSGALVTGRRLAHVKVEEGTPRARRPSSAALAAAREAAELAAEAAEMSPRGPRQRRAPQSSHSPELLVDLGAPVLVFYSSC
jgi:hypothetical protein